MKKIIIAIVAISLMYGCSTNPNNNGGSTTTVVPVAPTNLVGTVVSTSQVNLTWTDNATNEVGYKVQRKTGSGNYVDVASTGTDIANYSDIGLTPNTTYMYRVYAYNSAGNSLQYSNEVSFTTQETIPSTLNNGLVGYWPFNGNVNDESGNGNNGSNPVGSFTTDRFNTVNSSFYGSGSGTPLPGSGMYLSSMNNFPFGNSSRSISVWFKCDIPYLSGDRTLFSYGDNTYTTRFSIYLTGSSIGVEYMNGTVLSNFIPDNNWHNIIATYNGTGSSGIVLYLDGVLTSSNNSNPTASLNTLNSFIKTIGRLNDIYNFSGNYDDIRIYNRVLSQSEINYLATH